MPAELIRPSDLDRAAGLLRSGKLVAFPTDTFFALGAVIEDAPVRALFAAKGRMEGNPVPVLLASADQVGKVAETGPETAVAEALAREFWPGALTIVLPAKASVPESVTAGTGTVGVRVPNHALARQLMEAADSPLTGTSANLSGEQPCKTAAEVMAQLSDIIDAVVDAPCGEHTAPSTVVRFTGSRPEILRQGSVPEVEIARVAGSA